MRGQAGSAVFHHRQDAWFPIRERKTASIGRAARAPLTAYATSCATHRTAAQWRIACTGTTTRWFSPRPGISPVADRCLCASHRKTVVGRPARKRTTNRSRLRLRGQAVWYHRRLVLQACADLKPIRPKGNRQIRKSPAVPPPSLRQCDHQPRCLIGTAVLGHDPGLARLAVGGMPRRAPALLRVLLRRDFVEKRQHQPSGKNHGGTTHKLVHFHRT